MSADSPRRSSGSRGFVAATVPPQVVSDRSILDSAIGFINDVALTNQPHTDPKDTITWARFETSADISDPRYGDDWELEGNVAPPLLLILGYGLGVQVWAIPANGEAVEVLSWRHGIVSALRVLPTPQTCSSSYETHGRADEVVDLYADKRPLIAIVDGSTSAGSQPQFCAVNFVSLKTGTQVKTIKFKNPVLDVLANRTSIVITFHERIAVFDSRTLEDRLSITTCFPSPGINPNPVALGPRWLAYAEHKLLHTKRSGGGCDGEGVASYTATVLNAAKSLGKGLRELGEQVAAGLTGTNASSSSNSKNNSFDSQSGIDAKQPGVVTILDIKHPIKDYSPTTGTPLSGQAGSDPIVAHFIAHSEAVVAMDFDNSGMLLVTADRRGHDFHIFRIQPHPVGSSLAAVHHLYVLHRGDTSAKVQNIAFSLDARWVAVSTLRGTTHVFPITPYGGPMGVRTHTSLHVVNKLSRFHRSAGLSADGRSSSPISHSESTTFTQSLQPYHNPTLPPFPRPTVVQPLAQLRQPFVLGSPPSSAGLTMAVGSAGGGGGGGSGGGMAGKSGIGGSTSQRQRLSSLSDDNGKPLSVCAIFAKSRSWLLEPPNVTREAPHRMQRKAVDSLFVMAGHGALIQYDLDTKLASNVAKEKICDETPIELEVEAKAQWNLGRRREGSQELMPPLSNDNWLIRDRNSCVLTDSTRQFDDGDDRAESWLSQVEIITHAGPHRRLWMGPQFVFKTYNAPSGSNLSHVDAEAVEIGVSKAATAAAAAMARAERSSPISIANRSAVPVLIESGSYSSIEQSPKLMDRFRHDHLDSDFSIAHGDSRLKEDLADAMRESPSISAANKEAGRFLPQYLRSTMTAAAGNDIVGGAQSNPNMATENPTFYDALAEHEHYEQDAATLYAAAEQTSFDANRPHHHHHQHHHTTSMASAAALASVLPNLSSYDNSSGYESFDSSFRKPTTTTSKTSKPSIEKIVNPLGTVTTVTAGMSAEVKTDMLDEVVSQLAAEESVIHENLDEALFRPVVAIFCDENERRRGEEEAKRNEKFRQPPELIDNKLIVPVIAKEVDAELSKKEKQKNVAKSKQQQQQQQQQQQATTTTPTAAKKEALVGFDKMKSKEKISKTLPIVVQPKPTEKEFQVKIVESELKKLKKQASLEKLTSALEPEPKEKESELKNSTKNEKAAKNVSAKEKTAENTNEKNKKIENSGNAGKDFELLNDAIDKKGDAVKTELLNAADLVESLIEAHEEIDEEIVKEKAPQKLAEKMSEAKKAETKVVNTKKTVEVEAQSAKISTKVEEAEKATKSLKEMKDNAAAASEKPQKVVEVEENLDKKKEALTLKTSKLETKQAEKANNEPADIKIVEPTTNVVAALPVGKSSKKKKKSQSRPSSNSNSESEEVVEVTTTPATTTTQKSKKTKQKERRNSQSSEGSCAESEQSFVETLTATSKKKNESMFLSFLQTEEKKSNNKGEENIKKTDKVEEELAKIENAKEETVKEELKTRTNEKQQTKANPKETEDAEKNNNSNKGAIKKEAIKAKEEVEKEGVKKFEEPNKTAAKCVTEAAVATKSKNEQTALPTPPPTPKTPPRSPKKKANNDVNEKGKENASNNVNDVAVVEKTAAATAAVLATTPAAKVITQQPTKSKNEISNFQVTKKDAAIPATSKGNDDIDSPQKTKAAGGGSPQKLPTTSTATATPPPTSPWQMLSGADLINKHIENSAQKTENVNFPSLATTHTNNKNVATTKKTANLNEAAEKLLTDLTKTTTTTATACTNTTTASSTSNKSTPSKNRNKTSLVDFPILNPLDTLPPLPTLEPLEVPKTSKENVSLLSEQSVSLITFESPQQEHKNLERKPTASSPKKRDHASPADYIDDDNVDVDDNDDDELKMPTLADLDDDDALPFTENVFDIAAVRPKTTTKKIQQTNNNNNYAEKYLSSSPCSSASEEIIVLEEKKMTKKQKRKRQQLMQEKYQQQQQQEQNLAAEVDEELRPLIDSQIYLDTMTSSEHFGSAISTTSATAAAAAASSTAQFLELPTSTSTTTTNTTTTDSSDGPMPATTSDDNVFVMPTAKTSTAPNKVKTKKLEHKFNLFAAIEAATSTSNSSADEEGGNDGGGRASDHETSSGLFHHHHMHHHHLHHSHHSGTPLTATATSSLIGNNATTLSTTSTSGGVGVGNLLTLPTNLSVSAAQLSATKKKTKRRKR